MWWFDLKRAREGNIREERTDESNSGKGGKQKRSLPVASNSPVVSEKMWMNLPQPCPQQRVIPCEVVDLPVRFSDPAVDKLSVQ
ncbi:hypothetical protein CesoFtcFv8_000131 [Champsocephalus esox]|uniref:Uncharacterized protein n=1 Tax=Champsocephalus esox TaxID=159716 RepID=A0AAN8DYC9_9TELE|nr:hypothetical protein CesoFtcFv8_000131 [Champsocephalus esox]